MLLIGRKKEEKGDWEIGSIHIFLNLISLNTH